MEWRKRKFEDDDREVKRPRFNVYFRLESESSIQSDEDTESIDSVQGKETDVVRDTTDTDSKSDVSDHELEIELEYEVASLSDDEDFAGNFSSSGAEDLSAMAEGAIAVLCDSSLEAWASAGESSDSTSVNGGTSGSTSVNGDTSGSTSVNRMNLVDVRIDFWTCVQCKSHNNNPKYRYCEKCFQVRKTMFPPRPRGNRKRKLEKKQLASHSKVKLDTLQSCLQSLSRDSGPTSLSQDSGLGSSQELTQLDFNKIVVPEHLKQIPTLPPVIEDEPPSKLRKLGDERPSSSQTFDEDYQSECKSEVSTGRKRKFGFSGDKSKISDDVNLKSDGEPLRSESERSELRKSDSEVSEGIKLHTEMNAEVVHKNKDLCIICNTNPKDGIFLHGSIGHTCCCYKCAMRTWTTCKRCPVCNCKVNNVVKLYVI